MTRFLRLRIPLRFRARLVLATTVLTLATLGGGFATVYEAVNRAQQRELDQALLAEARREAEELGRGGESFSISERPGPAVNDVGPLPKHAALIRRGTILTHTTGFESGAHRFALHLPELGRAFDFWYEGEHLRAVAVPLPNRDALILLLAVPRTDLDGDAAFLRRAMIVVFLLAVGWSVLVALAIVRRLTHIHQRIARVVHSVARGNLDTRVAAGVAADELAEMGREVDDLVDRLSVLVKSQQQFIANAAHELRSPLTALYGELSLALRRPRSDEEYRQIIATALESARRLKVLAEDLLVLARIGANGHTEAADVPLAAVLADAIDDAQAGGNECVALRVPPTSLTVRGRHLDLTRLFRNLVENAVRHSPAGGAVTITARPEGEWVLVSVEDEGPGIPPHERARVFEPFFRGADVRGSAHAGAGLGLTIARNLAGLHGGDLQIEGAEASGARFTVRLPAGRGGGEPRTSPREPGSDAAARALRSV